MKVCHLISYSADSHYLVNLGKGLAAKGISISVGTLFSTGSEIPKWTEQTENIDYFCLNANGKKDFPKAVWKLSQILRRQKFDILQTHLYEASLVGLLAAKFAKTPIRILTRHHLDQTHQIGNKLAIWLDRWEARDANRVVVLSNAVREFMISDDGINADKIKVIYQGFEFEHFSATVEDGMRVRKEFGLNADDFVIGVIGNFFPTKGHRFLISAAKKLNSAIPNLKFLFVGEGSEADKSNLKAQIESLGLTSQVIFAGFRKDVNACMKAVDVVVHPSLSEAFCQVLIETMSVGTPIVSTNVGGAPEVIENGVNGILIPPEDVDAIVKAIGQIYEQPTFAENIALTGQKNVRERFTIENMVNSQIDFYQQLLNEKK